MRKYWPRCKEQFRLWEANGRAVKNIPDSAGGETLRKLLWEAFSEGLAAAIDYAVWNRREMLNRLKEEKREIDREIERSGGKDGYL
jgi:hypothetical protein